MLETKEQKQIFGTIIGVIILLVAVNFFSRANFKFVEKPVSKNPDLTLVQSKAYLNYLNSLKIDKQASQQVFQKILSEEDVKAEVEDQLSVNQKIEYQEIPDSQIKISKEKGQKALENYIAEIATPLANFNARSTVLASGLFSKQPAVDEELERFRQALAVKLNSISVPEEAINVHKSLLLAVGSYSDTISASGKYALPAEANVWPEVYKSYAKINKHIADFNSQYLSLLEKYKIALLPIKINNSELAESGFLIPKANAFLGVGDVTIVAGNIPDLIRQAVEEGLTAAFTQFMGQFLNKMLAKIEENYKISNFLYYTDALVAGQYTDDYLKKYVSNSLDKKIIKRFIPQLSCGKDNLDLKPFFEAKAQEYLGFDPSNLSVNDPNYYTKLNKLGSFLSTADGWQTYYEDVASQVTSEAEKAAERELISPGLKSPRDTLSGSIQVSINSIVSAQRAGFGSIMQLGISSAKNFISKFISSLTQTLVTRFVFRGATANGNSLGVLTEQSACLAAAQVKPVLPVSETPYVDPQAPPNSGDLIDSECAKLPRGCTAPTPTQPN
jgi:hypothetical protein